MVNLPEAELRHLFRKVRAWVLDIDEALEELAALVEGVKPPPPDTTGNPLPGPPP